MIIFTLLAVPVLLLVLLAMDRLERWTVSAQPDDRLEPAAPLRPAGAGPR